MYQDRFGKKWWKGNLHTHTTRSDGRKTPEEAIRLYREAGYDFLALTDHWVPSEGGEADGLLLLPGCEYDVGREVAQEGIYHIVSIGAKKMPDLRKSPFWKPQQILDIVHEAGGFAILAHPAWSLNRPEQIEKLRGVDAAEIYNTMSGNPWNGRRADSSVILDEVSAGGESGENARPCDFSWVLNLREQALDAGAAFTFHQTGARLVKDGVLYKIPRAFQHSQAKKAGIDILADKKAPSRRR